MKNKKCKRCGKKVNSRNKFCPNCGFPLKKENSKDWGMLGREDIEERDSYSNSPFEGITGNLFNKMLRREIKMLEKEMKKEMKKEREYPKTNVRLMINGKEINLKELNKKEKAEKKEKVLDDFSKNELKNFSKLPKKEPKTNIKRLSDTLIYEISLPGVKSIKEISIRKLEKSIEIRAVSKDKAYSKIIPVNLPILDYELEKGKLILELETKN